MKDYVSSYKYNGHVSLCFENEEEKPHAIGEKMCEIYPEAYMNGYNWDAFFNYSLFGKVFLLHKNSKYNPYSCIVNADSAFNT